ncbi:MAG: V-type ATP synthase subunit E [Fervidicoccaceae archaeon]|nr:V-type ATP synthase subunit E [Fervidicoccaceae archaeon]
MSSSDIEEMRVIKEKLLSEAREKAENIVREAEEKANEIIRQAEEEWRRRYEEYKRQELKKIYEKNAQIESEARLKARIIVSQTKAEIIEKLFEDTKRKLEDRQFDVKKSLELLLTQSLKEASAIKKIVVSPKDKKILEDIISEFGLKNIDIKENENMIGGLIVESVDGVIIDNSYDTRLLNLKEKGLNEIQRLLWGE